MFLVIDSCNRENESLCVVIGRKLADQLRFRHQKQSSSTGNISNRISSSDFIARSISKYFISKILEIRNGLIQSEFHWFEK